MSEPQMNTCANCRFWNRNPVGVIEEIKSRRGVCHRYPADQGTHETYWCGEHRPLNAGQQAMPQSSSSKAVPKV